LFVGKSYQGGIIAYIDNTGQHGFIAAPSDQSAGIVWYSGTEFLVGTSIAIGTGQANTTAIVTDQGAGTYAASICDNLTLGGYSDWYLPSREELYQLYVNKNVIGGFDSSYWSSSEYSLTRPWTVSFYNGSYDNVYGKGYGSNKVRCVRSF